MERLGEIRKNTFGTEMKIIRYNNSEDIDVQFLDDYYYVYHHTTYSNFKNGCIKNPYDKSVFGIGRVGDGKYLTYFSRCIMLRLVLYFPSQRK